VDGGEAVRSSPPSLALEDFELRHPRSKIVQMLVQ
jgi:hypothetical protein